MGAMLEGAEIDNIGYCIAWLEDLYLCSPRDSPTIPVGRTICVGGGREEEGGGLAGS